MVSLLEDIFANSPDRHVSVFELVWEQGDHENTDFENQKILPMIYVRDTTEKFVLCENYAFRLTTEIAGLMQPPKPVLELLTVGPLRGNQLAQGSARFNSEVYIGNCWEVTSGDEEKPITLG